MSSSLTFPEPTLRPPREADERIAAADAADLERPELGRLEIGQHRLSANFSTGPGRWRALRFTVGQIVLGIGVGPPAALRAWHRRFQMAEIRQRRGALHAFSWAIKAPLRAVRDARVAVADLGPACRHSSGVPRLVQLTQLVWLRLVHGVDPHSYYQFRLYLPERRRRAGLYLLQRPAAVLYRVLVEREALDDAAMMVNKRRFDAWCRRHGLPLASTLAEFRDGRLVAATTGTPTAESFAGRDLFSKPIHGHSGEGARRWRWDEGCWTDGAGRRYDWQALAAALAEQSRATPILLQECLRNHAALADVSAHALSTVRFVTSRAPDGEPEIVHAVYRTGVGASATDNLSGGGIAVAIEPTTGRLGNAIRNDSALPYAPIDRHPDSGARFSGTPLPHWHAARHLVVHAHRSLDAIAFVGWDVALTPSGPVLVEANFSPGRPLSQVPSGTPAGETNHLRHIDAHLRRSFGRTLTP
ncbi:MAG TPA: sugar-transfer associated ATP-grasp domain-containing protein [Gemmatimonadaceae bacterium]|nr:sugar-transfer associated ATP-grasp domain-containing protein [Gemmatimonadaceae bacterium]